MRSSSEILLVAVSSLVLAACGERARASQQEARTEPRATIASIEQSRGDVRYRAASHAAWTRATIGQALEADDAVQTMVAAEARIRFEEGAAIARLGPSTTLRIPAQAPRVTRLSHVAGQLVARVESASGGNERMEVTLPPGTLVLESPGGVAGAAVEARLEVEPEQTRITMVAGSARLERSRGGPVRLTEEQYVALGAGGDVIDRGRAGAVAALDTPEDGATVRTRDTIDFAWTEVAEVTAYRLFLAGDGHTVAHDVSSTRTSVAVPAGTHSWSVRGVIDGELLPASETRTFTAILDRQPPALVVTSPPAGGSVSGRLVVAGRAEPGARVEIDGDAVVVSADGSFETAHQTPRGLANIVVRASDGLGNTTVVSRSFLRE